MGNTPRKSVGRSQSARPAAAPGRHRQDDGSAGRVAVTPQEGDVLYPDSDLLQTCEATLHALRRDIETDPEVFLLDNLLMAVQFFKNYHEEVASMQRCAGMQSAPLSRSSSRRVLRPDSLCEVAARHVAWRPRPNLPDQRITTERQVVLNDSVRLQHDTEQRAAPHRDHRAHCTLTVESEPKPGFVKLRRVQEATDKDLDEPSNYYLGQGRRLSAHQGHDLGHGRRLSPHPGHDLGQGRRLSPHPGHDLGQGCSLNPHQGLQRHPLALSMPALYHPPLREEGDEVSPRGSPRGSITTAPHSPRAGGRRSAADSAFSSDSGSLSMSLSFSFSDRSSSGSRRTPIALEDFRLCGAAQHGDHIPEECFQMVMVQSVARPSSPLDDELPEPTLHLHAYLRPAVFLASFADAFHDSLAAAMGFTRESVALATVRGGPGPAAIQCGEAEVTPALALPAWPPAAAEWVFRARGDWPAVSTVRLVYGLPGAAVVLPSGAPVAQDEATADLGLHWALAFPRAEQVLELSLPARQAHCYLTLLALQRQLQGTSVPLLRSFFLRHCERGDRSPRGWAPGRTLRSTVAALYSALQTRTLPDYFVSERNLLAEVAVHRLRRVQERVFRMRENLLLQVLRTCRKLVHVRPAHFYPRLDYDRLTAILTSPDSDPRGRRQHPADDDQGGHDDLTWIANYRRRHEQEKRVQTAARYISQQHTTNITVKLGKHSEETRHRTAKVLKLFCEHFINMGDASIQFNANEQAWLYFRQSLHLLTLLEQDYGCPRDAKYLLSKMRKSEKNLIENAMEKMCKRNPKTMYGSIGNLTSVPRQAVKHTFGSFNALSVL